MAGPTIPAVGDESTDVATASQSFVSAAELFADAELARVYTDVLLNGPTRNTDVAARLNLPESTTSTRVARLTELGIVTETNEGRANRLVAEPILFTIQIDQSESIVTPTMIAVLGAREAVEGIDRFVDRHGRAKLVEAVQYTLAYLDGDLTRRGVGRALNVSPVEGIEITQAIEPIVALVGTVDEAIPELAADVHERKRHDAPYTIEE